MLRKGSPIILGGIAVIALIVVFAIGDTFATRAKATEFLSDVKGLQPGKSSLEELLGLKKKYVRFAQRDNAGCDRNNCTVYFSFDNRWLYRLHALPAARFGGGITVKDGVVTEINLALASGGSYSAQVVDVIAAPWDPPYRISGRRSSPNGPFIDLKVRLTPAASERMRSKAYSFNLSCLTRMGGCRDGRAMLPSA